MSDSTTQETKASLSDAESRRLEEAHLLVAIDDDPDTAAAVALADSFRLAERAESDGVGEPAFAERARSAVEPLLPTDDSNEYSRTDRGPLASGTKVKPSVYEKIDAEAVRDLHRAAGSVLDHRPGGGLSKDDAFERAEGAFSRVAESLHDARAVRADEPVQPTEWRDVEPLIEAYRKDGETRAAHADTVGLIEGAVEIAGREGDEFPDEIRSVARRLPEAVAGDDIPGPDAGISELRSKLPSTNDLPTPGIGQNLRLAVDNDPEDVRVRMAMAVDDLGGERLDDLLEGSDLDPNEIRFRRQQIFRSPSERGESGGQGVENAGP